MRAYGLAYELAVTQRIQHGRVGGEESAPAHAHGGEDSYGVVVDDALGYEARHQAYGGSHGTQRRDREGDQRAVFESEEPVEDEVHLVSHPRDSRHPLVGGARVGARLRRRTKGEHHHYGRDAEHARNDSQPYAHAVLAAIEERVEESLSDRALALERDLLLVARVGSHRLGHLRIGLQGEILHQARRDDASDESTHQSHQRPLAEAQARHEGNHHQPHAEGRTEVGERHQLVFLEVLREILVFRQRDDGGVVAQESHHRTQRRHARQVEQRLHQRTQQVLQQSHHAELREQLAYRAHQHADGHDVEHRLHQQVIGRLHEGVEHVRQRHLVREGCEETHEEQ